VSDAEIYGGLGDLLAGVDSRVEEVWLNAETFVSEAARRALSGRGKRLRPTMLLLAAECAGGATETSVALAGVVEVVHAASLVHDDVVDGADARRGEPSANTRWGSKVAVLLGDYLVARALELIPAGERERWVPELARVAERMCVGQMREVRAAGRLLDEAEYLEIVREKTGSLFGFCGRAGAATGGRPEEAADGLEAFGERFGVAFQLADDILDLVGSEGRSGKPEARDLAEGKLTLPLILAAESGGSETREQLAELARWEGTPLEAARAAREVVEAAGAVDAAWGRVEELLGSARERLAGVPESEAKRALMALAGERFPMPVMG